MIKALRTKHLTVRLTVSYSLVMTFCKVSTRRWENLAVLIDGLDVVWVIGDI